MLVTDGLFRGYEKVGAKKKEEKKRLGLRMKEKTSTMQKENYKVVMNNCLISRKQFHQISYL